MFCTALGMLGLMLIQLHRYYCPWPAVVAIKGNFLLGLNFLVVSLYPIRVGATFMSSFLVNTALILAMASAVIQFSAQAFAAYASSTQIFDVFGSQVRLYQTVTCKRWCGIMASSQLL